MKRIGILGVAGIGLLSMAAVVSGAQAIAAGADGTMHQEKSAAVIAPEDRATPEQLTKLFDVMRIKQQMQSMRTMVPAMVQQQIQAAVKQTEEGMPAGSKLTPELRDKMQAIMNKYVAKAMDLYPADEMLRDMTGIYQKHLSKGGRWRA